MKAQSKAAALAAALACAGCASVVDGSTQTIYVKTIPEVAANCSASNSQGNWQFVSPASIVIKKSGSVLTIRCSKPGWQDGTFYAAGRASTTAMIGSMLPYVGLLNAAVDASTGAALDYPDTYAIEMKASPVPQATATQFSGEGASK